MMISRLSLGVIALVCGLAQALSAQTVVASILDTRVAQSRGETKGLETVVSVDARRQSLESVLQQIVTQAGLTAAFGDDVRTYRAPVTLQLRNLPARQALARVLQNTGIGYRETTTGTVAFAAGKGATIEQGTIVGKVVHAKTKQPVVAAAVTAGTPPHTVTTGNDGMFKISVPAGEHKVQVRGIGFSRSAKEVSVGAGATVTVEIALEPSASVLDEVVVTGTVVATARKEIATPITVITAEELEQRGITRIEQLFRGEVPGLLVLDLGSRVYSADKVGQGVSSTIYSRGSADLSGGANPIKTYVDGVELLDPSYLGTIDPRSIEKIEIVTGPQAATIYGSGAMGGVMQIFTKKGREGMPDVQLSMKYGILQNNFSQGKTPEHHDVLTLTGSSGPAYSYSGNLSYDYTGQWQPKLFSQRFGASLGTTYTKGRLSATTNISTSSTKNGTYRGGLSSNLGFQSIDLVGCRAESYCSSDIAARFYSDQVSTSSNQTIAVNADYRIARTWQHRFGLGRSQNTMALKPVAPNFAEAQVGADTLFQVRRLSGQRTSWNYSTSFAVAGPWMSSSVTLGASGSAGDQLSVWGNQETSTSSTIIGWGTADGPRVELPLNDKSLGTFGQAQIGILQQLYVTLGLRLEQNPNYGSDVKWDITPTHGLAYTFERGDISVKVLGSYGRATRPPKPDFRLQRYSYVDANYNISQYISRFANPELRPEYSRGPQGGIEFYYGNRGALTLNHYSQTITDLIQSVPVDSILRLRLSDGAERWAIQSQYQNVAKIRQMGWEGTASFAVGPFTARGTYSWNDSRVLAVHARASSNYKPGQVFHNVTTHTGHLSLGYASGLTSVLIATSYVGSRTLPIGDNRMYQDIYLNRMAMYNVMASSRKDAYRSLLTRVPGYAKSDLSASHRLTSQLSATMNVVNLGNSFQSDVSDLNPSLGRQTTLGVTYRFSQR